MIVRSQRHQFRPASTGVAVHQHQDEPHLPERLLQPQDRPQELHRDGHLPTSLVLTAAHPHATGQGGRALTTTSNSRKKQAKIERPGSTTSPRPTVT